MRDYRVTRETTTVVKRTMDTPVNWTDIAKMQSQVIDEWNALHDRTGEPFDNVIWFESDEDTISICYRETTTEPVTIPAQPTIHDRMAEKARARTNEPWERRPVDDMSLEERVQAAQASAWVEGYEVGSDDTAKALNTIHTASVGSSPDVTPNPYVKTS